MQFTDAWIAGRLGASALAAITPASVIFSLLSIFGIEALTGVTTQVSQVCGRGKMSRCGMVAWQGIIWALAMGTMALVYYPTAGTVFRFLFANQSEFLVALEIEYFQISLLGLIPLLVSTAVGNFFAGLGKSSWVMGATLVGVTANLLLSLGLAFGLGGLPKIGFSGIAWGTVWATVLQTMVLLAMFLVPRGLRRIYGTGNPVFNQRRLLKLIRAGLPVGLHGSLDFLAWGVVLVWLVSFFGEMHLAATSIVMRCINLSFLPADGLAAALLTLVGRSVGSRDYLMARRYTKAGFILIATWMSSVALIYVCFGDWIIRLFTDDPEIISIGRAAILWVAAFQFFDAMNVTYINALTGAGDTTWPSAVNFTLSLLVLFGGGLAMVTFFPQAGSSGVWAVATFYIFCQGCLFYLRWRTRAWQNPALLV